MSSIRYFPFIFAILWQPAGFAAAQLEDAIPMDLARLLFDPGNAGNFTVYLGIPDEFPQFELPDGFTPVVGMRQGSSQRVALQTSLSEAPARAVLQQALVAAGWMQLPVRALGRENGFVVADTNSPASQLMCHDRFGNISTGYAESGGSAIVSLNVYPTYGADNLSCAARIEQSSSTRAILNSAGGINAFMPRLEVPEGSAPQGISPLLNMPSGVNRNREDQTAAVLDLDWTLEAIRGHFAQQLAAQGWLSDGSILGSVSATEIWSRAIPAGRNLVGTFTVIAQDSGKKSLKFQITAID